MAACLAPLELLQSEATAGDNGGRDRDCQRDHFVVPGNRSLSGQVFYGIMGR